MAEKQNIDRIWWRNVQPGEFYNIERYHRIKSGGGSLYIEIPNSMVVATLSFLGVTGANVDELPIITIDAGVVGQPGESGPIEFHKKKGGRMRIARQNRQQPGSQRHPAWVAARGFPTAPDGVGSTQEALSYFPEGGLRIYIAKTIEGDYYAGFTQGPRPASMKRNDPTWDLYPEGIAVGGVINAEGDRS
ncbi:hypothetical protein PHACT_06080 [Pseudohongiella acticola]|uniref:Uncharacterized protein n=1 Tax=Pseudohongiella acticola TaxID=1524254 RepID=A0A1E8CK24_9GAMM|nr:hypothetical protein [Pseudohongiella acticola]OFE12758.1 hypothetical protein PHACT_06080 [Pseudohongiella acticola]